MADNWIYGTTCLWDEFGYWEIDLLFAQLGKFEKILGKKVLAVIIYAIKFPEFCW